MKLNHLSPRICIALAAILIAAPTLTAMGGETTTPLETAIESLEENTKDNITENMHDDVIDPEISSEESSETPESKDSTFRYTWYIEKVKCPYRRPTKEQCEKCIYSHTGQQMQFYVYCGTFCSAIKSNYVEKLQSLERGF